MEQLANNAGSTLAGDITADQVTLSVVNASKFPETGNFRIVIDLEIMICTGRTGNVLTMSRGEEGTAATTHIRGASVTAALTAAGLYQFISDHATAPVTSVAGRIGDISLAYADIVGLGNAATKTAGVLPSNVALLDANGKIASTNIPYIQSNNVRSFDYWVDSVNGDDTTGTGLRQSSPKKTIAAILSLGGSNKSVGLARNSEFPEDVILPSGWKLFAYGPGLPPHLNCWDVLPNASFTATGGGVYQIDKTVAGGNSVMQVESEGAFLTHASSYASMGSTPGTYWPATQGTTTLNEGDSNGGALTIYIHPRDGTNAITDGKAYRCSARQKGYTDNPDGTCTVQGIWCDGNLCADGSMKIYGYAYDCWATKGNKHSVMVRQGANVQNVRTIGSSWYDNAAGTTGGGSHLVYFEDVGDLIGKATNIIGCFSDGCDSAIFGHTGSGSYSTLNIIDCVAINRIPRSDGSGGTAFSCAAKKTNLHRCYAGPGFVQGAALYNDCDVMGCNFTEVLYRGIMLQGTAGFRVRIYDTHLTKNINQSDNLIYGSAALLDVRRCTFNHPFGYAISPVAGTKVILLDNHFVAGNAVSMASADLLQCDGNTYDNPNGDNGYTFVFDSGFGTGTVANLKSKYGCDKGFGQNALRIITTDVAINPHMPWNHVITKGSAAIMTLAAPTSGTDDGLQIWVTSSTAFAHTITATGLLQTGTSSVNVATFAAQAGAGVRLVAYGGKWIVKDSVGITFS